MNFKEWAWTGLLWLGIGQLTVALSDLAQKFQADPPMHNQFAVNILKLGSFQAHLQNNYNLISCNFKWYRKQKFYITFLLIRHMTRKLT